MERIIEVKPIEDFKVWVLFADNYKATIDIKPFITSGISKKLKDPEFFKNVEIDEFGGIAWGNGYDFCPNYLRELSVSAKL